ncbi:hypothetical protein QUB70_32900, partial [Microcoleus sp. A003_D6]
PIPQEKKFCGMGILPVLVIFARGLLVYEDDSLVTDVEAHRRSLSDTFDVALCPSLLLRGIISGSDCVYVRINSAKALESYL